MPDLNQSNDRVPANSQVVEAKAAESSATSALFEELARIPNSLGDVVGFAWEIAHHVRYFHFSNLFSEPTAENSPAKSDVAGLGESERRITVASKNQSVIEEGNRHSVGLQEFGEFFEEVELAGTKVHVHKETLRVFSIESSGSGSVNLREHPNLVGVRTEDLAKGQPATPGASIDFGNSPETPAFEGSYAEVKEGISRSPRLIELKVKPTESNIESKVGEPSRIGLQRLQRLSEGTAPREGAESRTAGKFQEPHDPFIEIGGTVALVLGASVVAGWYFSSQEDQAKAGKPSPDSVPATGVKTFTP